MRNPIHRGLVLVTTIAALAAGASGVAAAAPAGNDPGGPGDVAVIALRPLGDSASRGRATLVRHGDGTTVRLAVTRLPKGAHAAVKLHANRTSSAVRAAYVTLPRLHANAGGSASATGELRFRGRAAVALDDVADGGHTILVVVGGRVVASGVIPTVVG